MIHISKQQSSPSSQRGVGMFELIIATALGLFISLGVIQLYATSKQNFSSQEGVSRIQENLRFISSRMRDDLSRTGYGGCTDGSLRNLTQGDNLSHKPADTDEDNYSPLIGQEGTGINGSDTLSVSYFNAADRVRVDLNVKEYDPIIVNTNLDHSPGLPKLEKFKTAVIGDCTGATRFMITNIVGNQVEHAAGVTAPAGGINEGMSNRTGQMHSFSVDNTKPPVYIFVSDSAGIEYTVATSATGVEEARTCDASNIDVCAFFINGQEMVEGVHDLQFEYGVMLSPDPESPATDIVFRTADQMTGVDWMRVSQVRVQLSLNSVERASTLSDGKILAENDPGALLQQTKVFTIALRSNKARNYHSF